MASVKDLRGGNIEDDFDLTETFDHLRRHGHFKNLTMAMVRKADWEARRLLKEEARVSDMLVRAQAELDAMRAATGDGPAADDGGWECSEGDTSGADCRSTGDGLREATARQPAYFWIEAADKLGSRRTTGGDIFCVAIRGPSQVQSLACQHTTRIPHACHTHAIHMPRASHMHAGCISYARIPHACHTYVPAGAFRRASVWNLCGTRQPYPSTVPQT